MRMLSSSRYLVRRLQTHYIVEETRGQSYSVVIDVGAGTSPYRKMIKHERYIVVDIEDRGGADGAERVTGDLTKGIPLENELADLILCTEVLEHVPEYSVAMSELHRLLKPGGVLLVTVPFVWVLHEAPNDFFRFTHFGIQHLLEGVGFSKVVVINSNNYFYTLLQLAVIPLRHPIFVPTVFLLNVLGYVVGLCGPSATLPLNQHVRAEK